MSFSFRFYVLALLALLWRGASGSLDPLAFDPRACGSAVVVLALRNPRLAR